MPITIKDFKKGNFEKRNYDREKHPVAVLLRNNRNFAFTVKEISKTTKMCEDTIRSMLRTLEDGGLVTHKSPYFVWKGNPNNKKRKNTKKKPKKKLKKKKK